MLNYIDTVRMLATEGSSLSGDNALVDWLHSAIPIIAALIEIVGVAMIVYGCIAALWLFFRSRLDFNNKEVKLELAQALALALEFKLAAEILKSVIVHTISELILLASVVALRIVMTILIHWEIKTSEREGDHLTYRQRTSDQTLSARYKQHAEQKQGNLEPEETPREDRILHHRNDGAGTDASPASPPLVMAYHERGETQVMRPSSAETSAYPHGEYRAVTREEDGLSASIERQIRRITHHRRDKEEPWDDTEA